MVQIGQVRAQVLLNSDQKAQRGLSCSCIVATLAATVMDLFCRKCPKYSASGGYGARLHPSSSAFHE